MSFINEHLTRTPAKRMDTCIFNACIECNEAKCGKCGWNPAVVKERKKELRESLTPAPKHWKQEGV